MWEFFNAMAKHGVSPNECLFLFGIKEKITSKLKKMNNKD